jgi:hypothetical protein
MGGSKPAMSNARLPAVRLEDNAEFSDGRW